VRLRQAANLAINREDLIRYAAKGNGVIVLALLPAEGFGRDADLAPYPFAPDKARALLRTAGYADGLAITLIAPEDEVVAGVVVTSVMRLGVSSSQVAVTCTVSPVHAVSRCLPERASGASGERISSGAGGRSAAWRQRPGGPSTSRPRLPGCGRCLPSRPCSRWGCSRALRPSNQCVPACRPPHSARL
jgi:hypothetical protein